MGKARGKFRNLNKITYGDKFSPIGKNEALVVGLIITVSRIHMLLNIVTILFHISLH